MRSLGWNVLVRSGGAIGGEAGLGSNFVGVGLGAWACAWVVLGRGATDDAGEGELGEGGAEPEPENTGEPTPADMGDEHPDADGKNEVALVEMEYASSSVDMDEWEVVVVVLAMDAFEGRL
jgi:hypothetical protein